MKMKKLKMVNFWKMSLLLSRVELCRSEVPAANLYLSIYRKIMKKFKFSPLQPVIKMILNF